MTSCVICRAALDGTGARYCSASCGAEGDRMLTGLGRRQRRLTARLQRPTRPSWRRWLPGVRRRQAALHAELAEVSSQAATLLAAKLAPEGGHPSGDAGVRGPVDSAGTQTQPWRPVD